MSQYNGRKANTMADLKYLFIAELEDGTKITQTKDDVSKTDPTRSEYYDVVQSPSKVNRFSLVADSYRGIFKIHDVWAVSLIDGHFEHNGVTFFVGGENPLPGYGPFELIFFRERQHDMHIKYNTTTGDEISRTPGDVRTKYCLGWKCKIKGKTYQEVVKIV